MPIHLLGKNAEVKGADFPVPAKLPVRHRGLMAAEWSEADFQKRIQKRLAEIGKSASGALGEKGYSVDLIRNRAKDGRRIDTIVKIVDALDWDLAAAVGAKPSAEIDAKLLESALWAVDQTLPSRITGGANRMRALLRGAALFYKVLAQARERGEPISDEKDILAHARTLIAVTEL